MSNDIYPTGVRGLTYPVMKKPMNSTIVQRAVNGYEVRIGQWPNPMYDFLMTYEYVLDDPGSIQSAFSPYTDYEYFRGFWKKHYAAANDFLLPLDNDNWVGTPVWAPSTEVPQNYEIIDPAGHIQKAVVGGITQNSAPTFNDAGGSVTEVTGVKWQDQGAAGSSAGQVLQVVTDGTNYYTPLQLNDGGQFFEDLTDIDTSVNPLRLWMNGTPAVGGTCGVGSPDYQLLGPGLAIPGASFMGMYVKWCAGAPAMPVTGAFKYYYRVRFAEDDLDFEEIFDRTYTIGGTESKNGRGYLHLVTSRPNAA